MPQLQINQGPQDTLLFDNSKSYFTNVGYKTTANFQYEYRDIDPNNIGGLGSTIHFVIPKAFDLLGPVDLMVDVNAADGGGVGTAGDVLASWVDTLGYAMIEKINFEIGSNPIEEVTGENLNIINELMRDKSSRLGFNTIMRTSKAPMAAIATRTAAELGGSTSAPTGRHNRIISHYDYDESDAAAKSKYPGKRKLIIPLGLFFTKHPSAYFPLAAIAGCNDVRITVKLRTLDTLLQMKGDGSTNETATKPTWANGPIDTSTIRLRCHGVHVTGPEAGAIMNQEHVRLMKLWSNQNFTKSLSNTANQTWKLDLSFLHPVAFLIITFRRTAEIENSDLTVSTSATAPQAKGYFHYHGGEDQPNPDAASGTAVLTLNSIKMSLNGQERHPSLASSGLDREYLVHRVMPQLFSEAGDTVKHAAFTEAAAEVSGFEHFAALQDRKNIFAYPFCLNPEGSNPSGSVNFSKVSHAKMELDVSVTHASAGDEFRCDVYAVHYNWLQIKDGRALLSFA